MLKKKSILCAATIKSSIVEKTTLAKQKGVIEKEAQKDMNRESESMVVWCELRPSDPGDTFKLCHNHFFNQILLCEKEVQSLKLTKDKKKLT